MTALTEAVTELRSLLNEKAEFVGSEPSWGDGDPHAPKTPWGPAQQGYVIDKEVIFYSTAGHGGLRVSKKAASKLSDAAKKFGELWGGAYWYEEDIAVEIPFYEVEQWRKSASKWFSSLGTATAADLRKSLERWFPEYLKLAGDGYKEPAWPKAGETWEFQGRLAYGKTVFDKGDQVTVEKPTKSGVVFTSAAHPGRFALRRAHFAIIKKVEN